MPHPPRVLFVIPTLVRHGAEKQLALLARGFQQTGIDTHVAVLTHTGPYEAELRAAGVTVHLIDKRGKLDIRAYWRLKELISKLSPEVVQTFLFAANSYGRQAALTAGVRRVFGGERCVDQWKGWLHQLIDRRLAAPSERIVVNSTGVRDFYAARGIPAEKLVVIPNAVEPAVPSSVSREQLLAELGLPADTRLLAAVNRLWPQKRVKDLIWAADLLKVVRDDVHLLIIGDGPHRHRLERYRDQVHIADRVHFLGHRDDVPRMMPHFDCLWLASAYEGMPNAILEAMACAVPVVASDISGNRDLVVHGETGYLMPIGDRAALARHTNRLLDDAVLAARLGEAGRQRVLCEFSVEKLLERYRKLYDI